MRVDWIGPTATQRIGLTFRFFVGALLDLVAVSALAALPGLYFWRHLTSNPIDVGIIPIGDFTDLNYPFRNWASEHLARGVLPTWNPFISAGHPALGDVQFSLLYPIGWLFARLYDGDLTYLGLEKQTIAHFAIGAVGVYLFGRALGLGRVGSIVSSVGFAFGGYLTTFPVQQIVILQTAVWLPWILLGIEVSTRRREPLGSLIVAGGVVLAATAGHPQTLLYVFVVSAAYGVYRLLTSRAIFGGICCAIGAFAGLGLAAPALLPVFEHIRLTGRTDVGYAYTAHGFTPVELLGLLFWSDRGGRPLYVGPVLTALAIGGATARIGAAGFWSGLVAVGTLLTLGGNTFLYPAAYALVPGMQLFRDHERAAIMVVLGIAMLGGIGIRGLLARPEQLGRVSIRTPMVAAIVVASAFAIFGLLIQLLVLMTKGDERTHISWFGDRALLAALFAALAAALLAARKGGVASRAICAVAFVGLIGVDLFTASWNENLHPGSPDTLLRPTATVQFLRSRLGALDRVSTEGHLPADGNAGALFRLPDIVGNTPLELQSYREFGEKIDEIARWRLLSVRLMVTRRQIADPRLPLVHQDGDLSTYELRPDLRLPRAYMVHRAIVAPTGDTSLEATRQANLDEEVVIDREPPALDGRPPTRPIAEVPGAAVVHCEAERIRIETSSERAGMLVVSERDYPGWEATVDGMPTRTYRAFHVLRAVYVPAGHHVVEFSFYPPGLARGLEFFDVAIRLIVGLVALRVLALFAPGVWRKVGDILRRNLTARRAASSAAASASDHEPGEGDR